MKRSGLIYEFIAAAVWQGGVMRPGANAKLRRRLLIVGASLVLGWYGCNLLLPRLTNCRPQWQHYRALGSLQTHYFMVCQGLEEFGICDGATSSTSGSVAEYDYLMRVFRDDAGKPLVIVLYPEKFRIYRKGLPLCCSC
jgi:hypothetical protein